MRQAFIYSSVEPVLSANSIDDAIAHGKAVCVDEITLDPGGANARPRLDAMFPQLQYDVHSVSGTANRLLAGECRAIITGRHQYDEYKMDPRFCQFRVAETLFPTAAGWITSPNAPCVSKALEVGFQQLESDGRLARHRSLWFPPSICGDDVDTASARRRLGRDFGQRAEPSTGRVRGSGSPRRRLAKASASTAEEGKEEPPEMTVVDFMGLFILWGIATIACGVANEKGPAVQRAVSSSVSRVLRRRTPDSRSYGSDSHATPASSSACGSRKTTTTGTLTAVLIEELRGDMTREFEELKALLHSENGNGTVYPSVLRGDRSQSSNRNSSSSSRATMHVAAVAVDVDSASRV